VHTPFNDNLTHDFLDSKRNVADPTADAVIMKLSEELSKKGMQEVFEQLITHVEMPFEKLPYLIQRFIRTHSQLPPWAEKHKIHLAQNMFMEHGPKMLLMLYFKSLPILYSMKNGAQVLIQTDRLSPHADDSNVFARRIAETGQFLLFNMASDGLEGNKTGIFTALKVRLIHAYIRYFISFGDWNTKMLGKPINQEDLAATLMTFSVSLTDGLLQFRMSLSPSEEEAYMHHWRVIGYFMGVDDDLLPYHAAEGRFLLQKILERQSKASREGEELTQALIDFVDDKVKSRLLSMVPQVMIYYLCGSAIAGRVGIDKAKYKWFFSVFPFLLKLWFNFGEFMERRFGLLNFVADRLSNRLVHKLVNHFDSYTGKKFVIPETLNRQWKV
jgi:hypothetical protein